MWLIDRNDCPSIYKHVVCSNRPKLLVIHVICAAYLQPWIENHAIHLRLNSLVVKGEKSTSPEKMVES